MKALITDKTVIDTDTGSAHVEITVEVCLNDWSFDGTPKALREYTAEVEFILCEPEEETAAAKRHVERFGNSYIKRAFRAMEREEEAA